VIRVLGLGNVLMSDDGFGPYVARVLEAFYEFPHDVEVIDMGTPGLDLTPYLLNTEAVIFMDTVTSSGAPGETRVYDRAAILRHAPQARTGPHDPALKEALLTVDAAGAGPGIVKLIGVIPAWIATGVTLSPAVSAAVTTVARMVIDELDRMGVRAIPRPVPRTPHIWWERESPPAMRNNPQSGDGNPARVP
jgi:hydrogenase maturation protease